MRLLRTLLFVSGVAGLIYQVVWTRLLTDVTGSTALAMTAVFSVFLASLALGAWLFGHMELIGDRALRGYGLLELAVAVAAVGTSALLLLGEVWLASLAPASGTFGLTLGFTLGVAALLLGPPVVAMGATLPAAVGAATSWRSPRREVGHIYGWNTLGAAVGALASGFVLIRVLGIPGTLAVAVALNLAAGAGALLLHGGRWAGRGRGARAEGPEAPGRRGGTDAADGPGLTDAGGDGPPPGGRGPSPRDPAVTELSESLLWPLLAFVSGFAVLGYEILWGRIGHFLLGDRTLAVSGLLAVVVGALGLGSLLAARRAERSGGDEAAGIGALVLLGGVLHLATVPLAVAIATGRLLPGLVDQGFLPRLGVFAALVGTPMVVLGMVFPLLLARSRSMDRRPGRTVGDLYLVNTVGAVTGAVVASWALSRLLGTPGSFLALSALLVVVGSGVVGLAGRWPVRALLPLAATAALVLAGNVFPRALVRVRADERLVALAEDEYGVQTLTRSDGGYLRARNNRLSLVFDLGHPQTAHAQQMPAHLSVLLAGDPDRVLNIGTGYGITAGTFTLYSAVESVVTVEILPFLVERQRRFGAHNFGYVRDPRVTLLQGDGRQFMLASDWSWDVISVNVLDPYLPGSSALYTVEFWERARERLRPGGVYTQLFWGDDVPLLVKGIRQVFPTVLYFPAYGGTSWNVVAFRDPVSPETVELHLDRLTPAARAALREVAGPARERLPALIAEAWSARRELDRLADAEPGPLHTDLRPVLEYRWSSVEGVPMSDSPLIRY